MPLFPSESADYQEVDDWLEFVDRYGDTVIVFRARWRKMFGTSPPMKAEQQYHQLRDLLCPPATQEPNDGE